MRSNSTSAPSDRGSWARLLAVASVIALSLACRPVDDASRSFDEALHEAYVGFDAEDQELAPILRNLESRMYKDFLVDDGDVVLRSAAPSVLTEEEASVVSPRPPGTDLSKAKGVSVAYPSPFTIAEHSQIPVLIDQRPVERQSPTQYDRDFLEGLPCWRSRDCAWLRTFQTLTKEYGVFFLPEITYPMYKDYRWVDLAVDQRGEDPRWAYIARTWNPESAASEDGGNQIVQSYTVEVWFPRDGRGFVWEKPDPERPETQGDSTVGGTLRMMTVWSQATTAIMNDPDEQAPFIRNGTNEVFVYHDNWLEEQGKP